MARPPDVQSAPDAGSVIAARFDALEWSEFSHHDKQRRDVLIGQIFAIRRDLMKFGEADMSKAARIWDAHVPSFVPRPLEFGDPRLEPSAQNTIAPGRRKRRVTPEPWLEEKGARDAPEPVAAAPQRTSGPGREETPDGAGLKAERHRMLLEGLEKQYLKAEGKYHFRDRPGGVAFEVEPKRLVTAHETPVIVGSMIDLAETRGWETLKLSGTDAFRREAWLQASLRGLGVSGFRPRTLDKVRLEEMQAELTGGRRIEKNAVMENSLPRLAGASGFTHLEESGRPEADPPLGEGQAAVLKSLETAMRARGDSDAAINAARDFAAEKLGKGRVHTGRLVETGTAPYRDISGEPQSHYAVLEDDNGRRQKVWGADLPRAIDEGKVAQGDKIALAFRGRKPVTVTVKVPAEDGKTVRAETREVERNAWEAVRLDRLREAVRDRITDRRQGTAAEPAGRAKSGRTVQRHRREPLR